MRPIVVYAPYYDEHNGGCIALHALVDRLRKQGADAYVSFYKYSPPTPAIEVYRGLRRWVPRLLRFEVTTKALRHAQHLADYYFVNKRQSGFLDTPVATSRIIDDAVVVYAESVVGNPLRSTRVVRWLLHRPGFFNSEAVFDGSEELFFFNDEFKGPFTSLGEERRLCTFEVRQDCYHEPRAADRPRQGICYLVRKGGRWGADAESLRLEGKTVIDGMSHSQIGEVFRRAQTLVSYDPNTLYLTYAALCGCMPVVMRPPLMDSALFAELCGRHRAGIAVGFEDVQRALDTRADLIAELCAMKLKEEGQVAQFLDIIRRRFG